MTDKISRPVPAGAPVDKGNKKPPPAPLPRTPARPSRGFFGESPVTFDVVANEEIEYDHHTKLMSLVFSQSVAVAFLTILLIVLAPFMEPIYHYHARKPAGEEMVMNPLMTPNLTNRAVISWTVTSVTDLMTIGFGDLIPHLQSQKSRFTGGGWTSFVEAFRKQQISQMFKGQQIVLTTVPSDTAVILAQGPSKKGTYEWKVQVPVIMTYETNNNVSQAHAAIVTLVIARVPPEESPRGIAIEKMLVN